LRWGVWGRRTEESAKKSNERYLGKGAMFYGKVLPKYLPSVRKGGKKWGSATWGRSRLKEPGEEKRLQSGTEGRCSLTLRSLGGKRGRSNLAGWAVDSYRRGGRGPLVMRDRGRRRGETQNRVGSH